MFADGGHDILTRQQRLCSERTADVVIVQSGVEQRQLARRVPQAGDIRRLQEIDGDLDAFEDVKEGRARGRALKGTGRDRSALFWPPSEVFQGYLVPISSNCLGAADACPELQPAYEDG